MIYDGVYMLGQKSNDVKKINIKLYSIGFLERKLVNDLYSKGTEDAVRRYQNYVGIPINGQVDLLTFRNLFKEPNTYTDNSGNILNDSDVGSTYGKNNPNSFWNESNDTLLRQNNHEITITYGEGNKSKTLKNVIFRSKQQVISPEDGSIEDVYSFIARDMIESEDV